MYQELPPSNDKLHASGAGNRSPSVYQFAQNFPNPFNPQTQIWFAIPKTAHVKLSMYDPVGREIRNLVDEVREAGTYSGSVDGTGLASGVYFYILRSDAQFVSAKKMLYIK